MDIVLIPGFWLDASSFDEVIPVLSKAGLSSHAVTLPGMESLSADRSAITARDHVDAVIAVVDGLAPGVVLVGHSGGGAIAHAVVDARPDRIARVVYLDAVPISDGDNINPNLPAIGGEVPLPDWSEFDDGSLADLDDTLRAEFRARAIPTPAGVTSDKFSLSDPRRYDVPVTVISCEMPSAILRQFIDGGHPYTAELARVRDVSYIDLPTSHWPQLTRPVELGEAIVSAVRPA